ncbi:MAG TPA: exodeoxyribonuclease VII large subunit [Beijerinckiaceae bacterium]|jgi:exodeoxyribonuclease VII large subunit
MLAETAAPAPVSNAPEWSVSDLAQALRRTLEDAFGHVRLRGEISGYRGQHGSGHAYFSLKDADACIDAVIWKSSFSRLRFKPQEGLEVIATGKVTTFPGRSKYQIVVESLEPAGVGALMALLDERRRKLAAEGLFDAARKKPLPFLPRVVGVVTSPTGAVIRDILHRLSDRFPRHVLVWPVRVQGETSAEEVAAAIRGFNALPEDGPVPRPDVLIVARGGGSLEDLWGFNEEIVVRAAAESRIPLVSAVGHETDTTLIDHAADRRAPTPTAAAEMVVPVWADLLRNVAELGHRQRACALKGLEHRRTALRSAARALPGPDALLGPQRQRLDLATARLKPALARLARLDETRLAALAQGLARHSPRAMLREAAARLAALGDRPAAALRRQIEARRERLPRVADRLGQTIAAQLDRHRERLPRAASRMEQLFSIQRERRQQRLTVAAQLLESYSYKSVLERGFALVRDAEGKPVRRAAGVRPGDALAIEFADGIARATAEGGAEGGGGKPARRKASAPPRQGTLFEP